MALQTVNIRREFKYNGMNLADPAPEKTPDHVRNFYCRMYPELTTAVIEGPFTKNGVSTYSFVKAAGSKG